MGATYQLEDGKGLLLNVYAPTRDSSEATHTEFIGEVTRSCRGVDYKAKQRPLLVIGDFNAPLTLVTNTVMDPAAISQLKGLMCSIGCKSAHSLCPSRRKWTCELPCREKSSQKNGTSVEGKNLYKEVNENAQQKKTENEDKTSTSSTTLQQMRMKNKGNRIKRQLDHILVSDRFSSSVCAHKVLKAPIPTTHCLVVANVHIKWRSGGRKGPERVPWAQLRDEKRRLMFKQKVWETTEKESSITWDNLSDAMISTCKSISRMRTEDAKEADTVQSHENKPDDEQALPRSVRDLFLTKS